jgi:site-specific DNA-methyltransferase (adenine-specific)
MYQIIIGDSVDELKNIAGETIDLIVTSPPYDNLRNYGGSINWDFDIFKSIANELTRVLKIGGVIVWVVNDQVINGSESLTSFKQAIYFKDVCKLNIHDTMIYSKFNLPLTHNRYEQAFEYMFVISKGSPKTFNPIKKLNKSRYSKSARAKLKRNENSRGDDKKIFIIADHGIESNIWHYSVGSNSATTDDIAFNHPAIFPEQLAYDHIISWSNENDLILDPFLGSGTVAKIALLTNRNVIGIEKNADYLPIINARVNNCKNDLFTKQENI